MHSLVYLHGYFSSPDSAKAQATAAWCAVHYPQLQVHIPVLPMTPTPAREQIAALLDEIIAAQPASAPPPALIGSSMGGFFANYFAEHYGCRAVLVNPAVRPNELFADLVASQENAQAAQLHNPYTGESCTLTAQHMVELRGLVVEPMTHPEHRMVLLETGDETLDYRDAEAFYRAAHCHIETGGDHSFTRYEAWLPRIAQFLQLG
ncbi:MAG: esterase YqiA [Pseudomonadales bacterium]|nr:esterase YqiA [Pseudomonadales bacterium]